jgi:hypothetical protein
MSICKTTHAYDNIWNLGGVNTIWFSGYSSISVRLDSRTCQKLLFTSDLFIYLFIYFLFYGFDLMESCCLSRCCTSWDMPAALLSVGNFQDGILWTIYLDFPPTMIVLHSASRIAKILFLTLHCHTTLVLIQGLSIYPVYHKNNR